MKPTHLPSILAGGLVLLAAWLAQRDDSSGIIIKGFAAQDREPMPEKYKDTVRKGLEYLAKQQHADGHWMGADGQHPVAMTGLVGVALLMERDNPFRDRSEPNEPTYRAQMQKAADWLMNTSQRQREGLFFAGHPSETSRYMEGHGLATLFLAGMYDPEWSRDIMLQKRLRAALHPAVRYIAAAQSTQGGWYHTSKVEGHDFADVLTTVIQVQALQAADHAGIGLPANILNDGAEYLKAVLEKAEANALPGKSPRTIEIAAALACFNRGHTQAKWFENCRSAIGSAVAQGRDELTHFYYAQALCRKDVKGWDTYRTALFDNLQSTQNLDGSWTPSPKAQEGFSVGPVHATALRCIMLQVDQQTHPSVMRIPTKVK